MAAQLAAWGRAKLPEPVYAALASTAEGVLALEQMMQAQEPGLARDGVTPPQAERGRAAGDDARPALLAHPGACLRPSRDRWLPPPGRRLILLHP